MTNFARMKAMTVDDMAEFFAEQYNCQVCINGSCDQQVSGLTCFHGIREWLLLDDGLNPDLYKQRMEALMPNHYANI